MSLEAVLEAIMVACGSLAVYVAWSMFFGRTITRRQRDPLDDATFWSSGTYDGYLLRVFRLSERIPDEAARTAFIDDGVRWLPDQLVERYHHGVWPVVFEQVNIEASIRERRIILHTALHVEV